MKILVAGEVKGRLDLLFTRVVALHASKAGPFDALFCVGDFYPGAADDATAFEDYLCGSKEAPVPTYFIEGPSASAEATYGAIKGGDELCAKVTYLGAGGLELFVNKRLTVGFLAQNHTEADIEKMLGPCRSSTYAGADLFLSTHWGQRVAAGYDLGTLLAAADPPAPPAADAGDIGDSTVADLAVVLRPRYHFAARPGVFFQRAPYKNHAAKPTSKMSHVTRFVSLGPVSESKDKGRKWLHAIGIEPIPYMTLEALVEEPADCTPSPYQGFAGAGAKRSADGDDGGALKRFRGAGGGAGGLSHEAMQAIQREEEAKRADTGTFFWGGGQGGRGGGGGGGGGRPPREVDPTNTTIFVGGLPPGFALEQLKQGFSHYGVVTRAHMPPNKDFAFVTFAAHEQAKAAIESRGLTLGLPGGGGVKLSWSTSTRRESPHPHNNGHPTATASGAAAASAASSDATGHYGPAAAMMGPAAPPQQRGGRGRGRGGPRGPVVASDDESTCWFCVGSGKAELELLVTIGEGLYMAVPKGPVTPEHVLLIPIKHVPAMARLSPEEWAEFERYKGALREMYAAKGLRTVLFERRLETRGAKHTHVQVIPVPEAKAVDVRAAFEEKGQAHGVFFESVPAGQNLPDLGLAPEQQYLYLEAPGLGGKGVQRLLYRLPPGGRLPLQYGRDVLAELLGVPEKVNWKNCELSKPEEQQMVDALKLAYAPFDFNETQEDEEEDEE